MRNVEPFKTVLSGNREAIAKLSIDDLESIVSATISGMTTEEFAAEVKKWLATAKHPRWNRPYTELIYQPMLEVIQLLRANGYKTWIVTGSGQDFVRTFSESVFGIPPEQVIGTPARPSSPTARTTDRCSSRSKLLLNDNYTGKPEGIHLVIGRRPRGLRQYGRRPPNA